MPPPKPPARRTHGPVDAQGSPVRFDSLPTTKVTITPTRVTTIPQPQPSLVDRILAAGRLARKRKP